MRSPAAASVLVLVLVLVHHTPVSIAADDAPGKRSRFAHPLAKPTANPPPPPPAPARTVVSIAGTSWRINGRPTHAGSQAEGLLPNARMIQGVFDDANAATRENWAYGNFDVILVHLTRVRASCTTPRVPCDVFYWVPRLIGCCLGAGLRSDVVTNAGARFR